MPRTIGYPQKINARFMSKFKADFDKYQGLLAAAKDHRAETREGVWRQVEKQYEGKLAVNEDGIEVLLTSEGSDRVSINLSHSLINVVVPYTTGDLPSFRVEMRSRDATRLRAFQQQLLLNRQIRSPETGMAVASEQAITDMVMYGNGNLLVSYRENTDRDYDDNDVPTGETLTWYSQHVEHLSPWDVYYDPFVEDPYQGSFIIRRLYIPKDELIEDERYHIEDPDQLNQYIPAGTQGRSKSSLDRSETEATRRVADLLELVEVFELYDLRRRRLISFCEGAELPLRVVYDITCPIVAISNHPLPHTPYSKGDLEVITDLQLAVDHAAAAQEQARKRAVSKILVPKGLYSPDQLEKLESDQQREVVEVETDDLSAAIYDFSPSPAPIDHAVGIEANVRWSEYVTGVGDILRGSMPNIRHTATTAEIINNAVNAQTAARLRRIERAFQRVGQLMLDIARDLYPLTEAEELDFWLTQEETQQLFRIASEDGDLEGLEFSEDLPPEGFPLSAIRSGRITPSAEIFKGRYEVIVDPYSTELQNPIMKANKYRAILDRIEELTMNGSLQAPNVRRAAIRWLEAEGIQHPEEFLQTDTWMVPPPAPATDAETEIDPSLAGIDPALLAEPDPSVDGVDPALLAEPGPDVDLDLPADVGDF